MTEKCSFVAKAEAAVRVGLLPLWVAAEVASSRGDRLRTQFALYPELPLSPQPEYRGFEALKRSDREVIDGRILKGGQ